jgi:hypothetical protein
MSVTFFTPNPKALLAAFDKRLEQTELEGKITTWEKHSDGVHYTHKAKEWRQLAFFKPSVHQGQLVFNIIKPSKSTIKVVVYGYYHGHLIETFLNHFDNQFTQGAASAQPTTDDAVN